MAEEKWNKRTSQADKDTDKEIEKLSEKMLDFKPYDRELFEKMTPEERRSYNNAFKLTGAILIICGILDFLVNLIFGKGQGWSLLMIVAGACMLCYWNNPFCFHNLWNIIKKLIAGDDF